MSQSFFTGMPDFNNISSSVLQSLEMMSQAWGQIGGLTGSAMPNDQLSVEELDRRIAELRAVENWLKINTTMLQSTIQGLEVQRSTVATLQAFAQSHSSQTQQNTDDSMGKAVGAWWEMMQNQFNSIAQATAATMSEATQASESASHAESATKTASAPAKKAAKKTTTQAKKAAVKSAKKTAQSDLKL